MRFDQMLGFRYSPGAKGRMANQLKMALVQDILTLRRHGWSGRRIARELGVCRETVGRYVNGAGPPKPASNAPTGGNNRIGRLRERLAPLYRTANKDIS